MLIRAKDNLVRALFSIGTSRSRSNMVEKTVDVLKVRRKIELFKRKLVTNCFNLRIKPHIQRGLCT